MTKVWPPRKLEDFGELTLAEKKLRDEVVTGMVVVVGDGLLPSLTPSKDVLIRASFIRYLLLGGCEACRPHEKGVQVKGACILGDRPDNSDRMGLDLHNCELKVDFAFHSCLIPEKVLLLAAYAKSVAFIDSFICEGIIADRLTSTGAFFLRGSRIIGGVQIKGAKLGGDFDCTNAILEPTRDASGNPIDAVSGDGLSVGGAVFLKVKKSSGTIRLVGANIGGYLDCTKAEFLALNDADGSPGYALVLDGLETRHQVAFDGADITGAVRLLGATIGGDLTCKGASFVAQLDSNGKQGVALALDGIDILGKLYLAEVEKIVGILSLTQAAVRFFCDDRSAWPTPDNLVINGFTYGSILVGPSDARSRLEWIALQDAKRFGADFLPQPYEQCAKVLREMGHGLDARIILIEKERLQRAASRIRMGHWWRCAYFVKDSVIAATTRYWHQPTLAFAWLAGLWLFGWVLFGLTYSGDAFKPNSAMIVRSPEWVLCGAEVGKVVELVSLGRTEVGLRKLAEGQSDCYLRQPEAANYPRFNSLIYAADTLLPIVDLEMQSYWLPDETKMFGPFARVYLWLQVFLGWALSLLAVAGFSGLVKRD